MAENKTEMLTGAAEAVMSDIQRSLGERFGELRNELMDEIGKAGAAGATLGGGLGMAALGTILGGFAFVHVMHRVTGMPLWACYTVSSGMACAAGAGLVAGGVKQASDLMPEGAGKVANRIVEHMSPGQ
jgi:hypothetical protein